MKSAWVQPSLSRDFALLSAAILFVLVMLSGWITYSTYVSHYERVSSELEKEATRIERTLGGQMANANYLLTALGKQIIIDPDRNLTRLAEILKSFDSKGYIYSIFSWVSADQKVVVSSNKGVLEKPVDISDRDYVKKSFAEPWKMNIGRPIEGRVSGRWVIPVAMGLTDYTGKFVGIIMISIDINTLTDQISNLVRRDGISFAIVSKTLIPLTQVSDDRDFVSNNFPTQKLVNVNFSKNPSGLIAQGSLFWGTGNYAYYRVSPDFPYIALLGYDAHYSDENVRGLLWSRLVQMLVMAIFFVLFLWVLRARMIRPVIEMAAIAGKVAKGEPFTPLPKGGPVELEGLAAQIRRVGEYIVETKRIEQELRHKMAMLKQSRDRGEMEKRSKSEFLAWVCQEMHSPLNSIIGSAQVMKDQLYGPIENKKYRQYASDIYATGSHLLDTAQDLLTLSKAETDYIELVEKPVDVAQVINKSLRFIADKMQAEKQGIKIKLQEPLPRLVADEFRLQQIVLNLMQYALAHSLPNGTMLLEARLVSENKDRQFFAIILSTDDVPVPQAELTAMADRLIFSPQGTLSRESDGEHGDLKLELARVLVHLHGGALEVTQLASQAATQPANDALRLVVMFAAGRIRFSDAQ